VHADVISRYLRSPLAITAIIDSLGSGAYLGMSIIVLTRYVGLGLVQASVYVSTASVVAFLQLVPLGALADRVGARRMLIALHVMRGTAYLALLAKPPALLVLALMCAVTASDRSATPLLQTVVGQVAKDDRIATMARVRVVQNIGFSGGAGLAALALLLPGPTGLQLIVLWNVASFFGAALTLLVGTSAAVDRGRATETAPVPRRKPFVLLKDGRFAMATVLSGLLGLHAPVLTLAFPLWITTRTTLPGSVVPSVVAGNCVVVVLLQSRLSRGLDDVVLSGRALAQSGLLLAGSAALMAAMIIHKPVGGGVVGGVFLALAVVAQAGAEIRQQGGAWGISYALSPEDRRATYLSFFSLGSVLRNAVAPLILVWVVRAPGTSGWLVLAIGLLLLGVITRIATSRWSRSVLPEAPST
jgi:MFS family permease